MTERWVTATMPGRQGSPDVKVTLNMTHARDVLRLFDAQLNKDVTLVSFGEHAEVGRITMLTQGMGQTQGQEQVELRPYQYTVLEDIEHLTGDAPKALPTVKITVQGEGEKAMRNLFKAVTNPALRGRPIEIVLENRDGKTVEADIPEPETEIAPEPAKAEASKSEMFVTAAPEPEQPPEAPKPEALRSIEVKVTPSFDPVADEIKAKPDLVPA
jgi:hypothetical protein